jgi:hypothetical protein
VSKIDVQKIYSARYTGEMKSFRETKQKSSRKASGSFSSFQAMIRNIAIYNENRTFHLNSLLVLSKLHTPRFLQSKDCCKRNVNSEETSQRKFDKFPSLVTLVTLVTNTLDSYCHLLVPS